MATRNTRNNNNNTMAMAMAMAMVMVMVMAMANKALASLNRAMARRPDRGTAMATRRAATAPRPTRQPR